VSHEAEIFGMTLTKLLLLPLILHVLLTFFIGGRSLSARIKSVVSGETKLSSIATDSSAWPTRVRQLGNNFDNQFDTPMMWYGVCALIVALQLVDPFFVILSWLFLASRVAHSYVHTTSNTVPLRMRAFLFGFITLVVMWLWFAFRLFVLS
jgi:hypothetical protein